MNRKEKAFFILPIRDLQVGTLIELSNLDFVLSRLRHWHRTEAIEAVEALQNAFNSGYSVESISTDAGHATIVLVRGEADTLLYGH